MRNGLSKEAVIYVAGHRGLVGSAILRLLEKKGYSQLLTRSSSELDLRDQAATRRFFETERPEYVFLAAARVGGIMANIQSPAEFIHSNLAIGVNVIEAAHQTGVTKLLNLGSSCCYPRESAQPIKEEYLLTGPLEPTNQAYAIAKIAIGEMCAAYRTQYGCNFISANPTNLYGPNDNFDPASSHVLTGLLSRFVEATEKKAPQFEIWGTGQPLREFLYVDDLAEACLFLMENYNEPLSLNVGTGKDIPIAELAALIKEITGYQGELIFDHTKPDGMRRKLLDVSRINALGWQAQTGLREGIEKTLQWFLENRK